MLPLVLQSIKLSCLGPFVGMSTFRTESYHWPHEFRIHNGNRIETDKFYPNVSSDFDMSKCPEFWRNRKIKINLQHEKYMDDIQLSGNIAIGLDFLVAIGSVIFILNCSTMMTVCENQKDEVGPWSKFGFAMGRVRCREVISSTPDNKRLTQISYTITSFKPFAGFGKVIFFVQKIVIGFGIPLVDTILGKRKLFWHFHRSSWVIITLKSFSRLRCLLFTDAIKATARPYSSVCVHNNGCFRLSCRGERCFTLFGYQMCL